MHDTTPSAVQKLLVAALDLTERGRTDRGFTPFTAEALTVAAWQLDPERFCLKGFKDHPCSNRTFTLFMGRRGIISRGYLEKVGEKLYVLTPKGRDEAERARDGASGFRALAKVQLARAKEDHLSRLLLSRATLRFRSGQRDTINLTDAVGFWTGHRPADIDALVDQARTLATSCGLELRCGRFVSHAEFDELVRVNSWLQQRFSRELERQRKAVVA